MLAHWANLSSLRPSGRAGDVAAGRAEVAGPRPGHVCAEVCGGGRAGAGWGAGEVSLIDHDSLATSPYRLVSVLGFIITAGLSWKARLLQRWNPTMLGWLCVCNTLQGFIL